jgi:nucleoside-diphosphate-sugar epimerase
MSTRNYQEMTKILLTGHKGFIGRHILALLTQHGYTVDGVDLGDPIKNERYDFIVHFGARTLIRNSLDKPYEYFVDGLDLTMRMLEKARKDGSMIVFPTSGSIEEPTNPYSLAKKNAVEWIQLYEKLYGLKAVILKLYNIYGEDSGKGALYIFCKAAAENSEITIYGNGEHIRDYTHVSDVAGLIYRIVSGQLKEGTYEVGTGVGTSVNQLISLVENVSGKKLKVTYKNYVVQEAEELHAKNSVLINPIPIDEGVKLVYNALSQKIHFG